MSSKIVLKNIRKPFNKPVMPQNPLPNKPVFSAIPENKQVITSMIEKVGPQGEAGPMGQKGEAGVAGPMGQKGEAGVAGPMGPKGEAGVAGPMGPKGEAGVAGPMGPKGEAGVAGPMGPKGDAGIAGQMGPKGDAGIAGPMGPKGDAGPIGQKGDAGAAGPAGPKGENGIGFNTITGHTNRNNILTANGNNSAIGNENLTYYAESNTLATGKLILKSLDSKNSKDDFNYNRYLVADANGNIGYNKGGNYTGMEYRDTILFNFTSNGNMGILLNNTMTTYAVFIQPPSSSIKVFFIGSNFTGSDNNTIELHCIDFTNTSSNDNNLNNGGNMLGVISPISGNNTIKIETKDMISDASYNKTGFPRLLGIRARSTGTTNNIYLLNIMIGLGI